MPKVRTKRTRHPKGFEDIAERLDEFEDEMREAELAPHEGKRKVESLWPVFQLNHKRSRFIYDLFYRKKEISREVYEYCLREKYADRALIAKWKKQGYEKLCCLQCIQSRDHNFGTTCICRVPRKTLDRPIQCMHCGCHGCSGTSGDVFVDKEEAPEEAPAEESTE